MIALTIADAVTIAIVLTALLHVQIQQIRTTSVLTASPPTQERILQPTCSIPLQVN